MPEEGRSKFKMQDSCYFSMEIPSHHSAEKPEEAPISATDTSTMDTAVLDISISDLPEVSIPPPLSSPLPLQCLAANALPDQTKKEIESVIAEFTSDSAIDSSRRESMGRCATADALQKKLVLTRDLGQTQLACDLGIGVKVTGGVKCSCGTQHAVVTSIFTNQTHHQDFHLGVCIVEWCGQSLEGATYEQAKRILNSTNGDQIEVVLRKCRKMREVTQVGPLSGHNPSVNLLANVMRTPSMKRSASVRVSRVVRESSTGPHRVVPKYSLKRPKLPTLTKDTSLTVSSRSQRPPPGRPASISLPLQTPSPREKVPKSPTTGSGFRDMSFDDLFSNMPRGMIELSLSYKETEQKLVIGLSRVRGYSKVTGETSDAFINTYLIPDTRKQGVRSLGARAVDHGGSSFDDIFYYVDKDEIDSTALRVILWETANKEGTTFRGEVLLSLSDREVVNMEGEPTWYTVCAEDPNLPKLPTPIHYKQLQNLLNRFKQKVSNSNALHYLKINTKKSQLASGKNSSKTDSLPSMKRRLSLPGKDHKKLRHSRPTSGSGLPEESEESTDSLSSEKSAKLISILQVLREDSPAKTTDEPEKKARLTAILHILRDDDSPPHTGEPFDDDDGDCSTLDRRKRKRPVPILIEDTDDIQSNPFSSIPSLRQSLKAGRRRKVTVYSFFDELAQQQGDASTQTSSRLSTSSLSLIPELQDVIPEDNQSPPHLESQLHYKLLDDQGSSSCSGGEDDSAASTSEATILDAKTNKRTSDCSLYSAEISSQPLPAEISSQPHPAEVSSQPLPAEVTSQPLPVDVSSQPLPAEVTSQPLPVDVSSQPHPATSFHLEAPISEHNHRRPSLRRQTPVAPAEGFPKRSRSVGDLLDDEEPSTSSHTESSPLTNEELETSLDSRNREDINLPVLDSRRHSKKWNSLGKKISLPVFGTEDSSNKHKLSKWKSFDQLLDSIPVLKPKYKSRRLPWTRKNSHPSSHTAPSRVSSLPRTLSVPVGTSGVSSGSIKLELHYIANTTNPLLVVDLVDLIFHPPKLLTSDIVFKTYMCHNSTGVCLLKNKAHISLKRGAVPPLASLQFETDITNLSLKVCLVTGGKMFSKKTAREVWLDLNALNLTKMHSLSQWFQFSKITTV